MKYDIVLIGHISKDIMIDYLGKRQDIIGGAVVYSSFAAAKSGNKIKTITKISSKDEGLINELKHNSITWSVIPSKESTSIKNIYHTCDKEKRDVILLSQAEPFSLNEILNNDTNIFYLAGLFGGEIPETLIKPLSKKAPIALDAQGVLRCLDNKKNLAFNDWKHKKELIPYITYLKTDAAEAKILTGLTNRKEAAKVLNSWGANEVILTHNTEVIVCSKGKIFSAPYSNRSNEGRTGRGDTTFAAYLAWRKNHSIEEAISYAAALCSLKMETPGPFKGSIEEVINRMR